MSEREQIVARLSDLQAKQEAATGWGAAVGAREEEIRSLESRLLRIDAMIAGNQPSSSGSVDALMHAIDSPTVMALAQVFRQPNGVLNRSYSEQIVDILLPRFTGVAQAAPEPDADLEHVRSALATLSDPLTIAVDGHLTGAARALAIVHAMRDIAATAALHLSAVTPSPGAGEPREKEITRLATIEECADIVEGQIVHHNCREWPAVSSQGNRASDDPIVQHCDKLAAAIRTLALPSTTCAGAVTKHSGTFLGYRDEHGNEMHCAHAFCPHQAKCHKGCTNPVAMTSTHHQDAAK